MSNKLNIYECDEIINQIEVKAEMNDGEISDEDMKAIVLAQTSSIEQLGKLVNYIKFLEGFETIAKNEIDRIQAKRKTAKNRIENIKQWILPYVQKRGKISVGTCILTTRKSKGVILADGFNNTQYGEEIKTFKPDKKAIKESIENGIEVKGASLEERINVQIR